MLEFSSLQLALIIVWAHLQGDTAMLIVWLCTLCSSLIHHASAHKREFVDHRLCELSAALCASRNIPVSSLQRAANFALGGYIFYVHRVARLHKKSKLVHVTIHTTATIVAVTSVR